jgi:hypothetical protein
VSKILIIVCVAASLSATSGRWAHAHTGSGAGPDPKNDARLDENYLGKDYSGDPTGALISIITGTPGYLWSITTHYLKSCHSQTARRREPSTLRSRTTTYYRAAYQKPIERL